MKLFYSYSHEDEALREGLEKHLSVLKQNGHIEDWHDRKIVPGQNFQKEIDQKLKEADIVALLISSDFLSSPACQKEMRDALNLREHKGITVVPIIVRPCDWKSSDIRELQALPKDGKPVCDWPSLDSGFLDVAEGIAIIAEQIKQSEIRPNFKMKMSEVEFVSGKKEDIKLQDIFIFPHLVGREKDSEILIRSFSDIWVSAKYHILRGDDRSGKTTICRKMFLERIESKEPTLLLSGDEIRKYRKYRLHEIIQRKFEQEFHGNYDIWKKKNGKMVIIDDFHIEFGGDFLDFAKEFFDYIFITISDDQFAAYYRSQSFLSDFRVLSLHPLKHAQQETLIRQWKALGCSPENQEVITDSMVDHLENTINSIVLRNRIVPRFPFYVLSILQAYEDSMPSGLQVTAYGHFYQVLIVAQLMRVGIAVEDLDSAFNCLSSFAFDLYQNSKDFYGDQEFSDFLENYQREFIIKENIIKRLISTDKPIIRVEEGSYSFRYSFAYYYLLGSYFAKNMDKCRVYIENLMEENYIRENTYILIFTIHHSHDDDLIDDILLHTMGALDNTGVAKLDRAETRSLEVALREIPERILTEKSVEEAREETRSLRDRVEQENERSTNRIEISDIYRALKNMEILGQILTNKYGSLSRKKAKEIITTVNDAGLRLVRSMEENLLEFEDFLVKKIEDIGPDKMDYRRMEKLQKALRVLILILVHVLIQKTSASIGGYKLSEVIQEVTDEQGTTAYKLIELFFSLNSAQSPNSKHELGQELANRIVEFLRDCSKDRNEVVRRIVSLEVQDYCNTHRVDYKIKQRLFDELKLQYRPNVIEHK